ncbi:MAG TPA: DUF3293 domain-containing protein [Azospirillaceae bacterium]|nr:DUF3293 domain-containing protein [Azospirillaceae bacterium]
MPHALPDQLQAAYRGTRYTAGDDATHVRLGERSAAIDAVLDAHNARSGVFITAWNPLSRPTGEADNKAATERLRAALVGWPHLPHRGIGLDPSWTPEEGFFVLDMPEDEAVALAGRFGQVAIVAIRKGEPARLLLTGLVPTPRKT